MALAAMVGLAVRTFSAAAQRQASAGTSIRPPVRNASGASLWEPLASEGCFSTLYNISWSGPSSQAPPGGTRGRHRGGASAPRWALQDQVDSIKGARSFRWQPSASKQCGFRRATKQEALGSLRGMTTIVVAGDSQARLLLYSLLRLLLPPEASSALPAPKRHAGFQHHVPGAGISLEFVWAPYLENITALVATRAQRGPCPDVLLLGGGLWHMLWVGSAADFGRSARRLKAALLELSASPVCRGAPPGRPGRRAARHSASAERAGVQTATQGHEGVPRGGADVVSASSASGGPRALRAEEDRSVKGLATGSGAALLPALGRGLKGGEAAREQRPGHVPRFGVGHRGRRRSPEGRPLSLPAPCSPKSRDAAGSRGWLRPQSQLVSKPKKRKSSIVTPAGGAPPVAKPFMFWTSPPKLLTQRLNTPRKREKLTRATLDRYSVALRRSGLLGPDGPCLDVDLAPLSEGCGPGCSQDGMHYSDETYEAGVQVMLNALRFAWRRHRTGGLRQGQE